MSEEEHRLEVSEKRVLRTTFGPKREEVTESWGKLHDEELHNLYCSTYIIRMIKSRRVGWAGHVTRMGDMKNDYILIRKPEGKRPIPRSWRG
jgi:hypothetical protein